MTDAKGHFIHFFCGYSCEEVWNYRWTTLQEGNHLAISLLNKSLYFITLTGYTSE